MKGLFHIPKNITSTQRIMRLYVQQLISQPRLLALSLLISPAKSLRTVVAPLLTAHIFTAVARGLHPSTTLLGGVVACFIVGIVCEDISGRAMATMDSNSFERLYNKCFSALVLQDHDFYSNRFVGSLVSEVDRLVSAYETFTSILFNDILSDVLASLLTLLVMAYYNLPIALVCMLLLFLTSVTTAQLVKQRIPIRRLNIKFESQQSGELADMLGNAINVKTHAAEVHEYERYVATNAKRSGYLLQSWKMNRRDLTISSITAGLLHMTVIFGGLWAVQHHTISLATFLLFQLYILRIIATIHKVALLSRNVEKLLGEAEPMALLLSKRPTVLDAALTEAAKIRQGQIIFKGVYFGYRCDGGVTGKTLFNDFNLSIKAGESIGLVGPSGGGKSSLTKLLLRFNDVSAGRITIDGQNIAHIPQADLHRAIAYVPQEPILFHRSIYENIAYGQPEATQRQIFAAARKAQAHEFIVALANGYETQVGERGIKLSGGQRQRIVLARAFLKQAPILVLDEATSALDSSSEQAIQIALQRLMKNRTSIVIAHRLSTVQRMDRIIVLDAGKIVEQGSHEQLLKNEGAYAKLWAHQSGGFFN